MYNEMTSGKGRKMCLKGWELSGIKAAVEQGLSKLPCLDPFSDIDPMVENDRDIQTINDLKMILIVRSGLMKTSKMMTIEMYLTF